jgi:hypothetical protein
MSQFLIAENFPHKCFNAQNHWLLGWFSDRSILLILMCRQGQDFGFVDTKLLKELSSGS